MGIASNPVLDFRVFLEKSPRLNWTLQQIYGASYLYFFGYARHALAQGVRNLGLTEKDSLLCPKYICGSALAGLHHMKIKIIFYDIEDLRRLNLDKIRDVMQENTKALLVIDYFGFPANYEDIEPFCKNNGLLLIEDSCHGFLSEDGAGRKLGTIGDIGIISIRKSLAIPNGALLLTKSPMDKKYLSSSKLYFGPLFKFFIRNLLRNIERNIPMKFIAKRNLKKSLDYIQVPCDEQEFDLNGYDVSMNRIASYLVKKHDLKGYVRQRRSNFDFLLKELPRSSAFRPLVTELPDGVVPFFFPVRVSDFSFFHMFCKKNLIEYVHWPTYPHNVEPVPAFKDLVFIPTHERLKM